jgi:predicted nucleotidyltransferase
VNVDVAPILDRRRQERRTLLARANRAARSLPRGLDVRAVVVFGSVARGDFNKWSDIDLLVVAESVAERLIDRHTQLGPLPGRVQPIVWTREEFREKLRRDDPITSEVANCGVWLHGCLDALTGTSSST